MTALRQMAALVHVHVRVWLRTPRQISSSLLLSCAYLLVGTQILNIVVGPDVRVGLYSRATGLGKGIAGDLSARGMSVVTLDTPADGPRLLSDGALNAYVSIVGRRLDLELPGRNPLIDRELDGILLRVAAKITQQRHDPRRGWIAIRSERHTPEDMSTFMTATIIPFLILSLTMVNCGMHWLKDWEVGTINSYAVSPAPRWVLVVARSIGGGVLALVLLLLALALSRQLITWRLPVHWGATLAVLLLQLYFGLGFFFVLAAICRKYIAYTETSMLLVIVMMFTSGTIKPLEVMAPWERLVAYVTPAFYSVRLMRAAMLDAAPLLVSDMLMLVLLGSLCFGVGYILFLRARIQRRA